VPIGSASAFVFVASAVGVAASVAVGVAPVSEVSSVGVVSVVVAAVVGVVHVSVDSFPQAASDEIIIKVNKTAVNFLNMVVSSILLFWSDLYCELPSASELHKEVRYSIGIIRSGSLIEIDFL